MPLRRVHATGNDDGLKYTNGYKSKVQNREPIITPRGINAEPPQDMYFKGALFLNTLRSVVNDDKRWWTLLHDFYQHFKYQNIMTEDVVAFFNQQTGKNLTPIFDQYLRHTALPDAGAEVRRGRRHGLLPLEGRRARVRDAGPRRHEGPLADDHAHDRVADDEDAAEERRIRRRDGSVLHQREETIT